ncbi:MAG: hypothetical protein WCA46_26010 [Actinocatenispora sp.]
MWVDLGLASIEEVEAKLAAGGQAAQQTRAGYRAALDGSAARRPVMSGTP